MRLSVPAKQEAETFARREQAPTLLGVLGMLRTTVQLLGTQSRIMAMVVPARIEMSSLPSRASVMPGASRTCAAICGLQLRARGARKRRLNLFCPCHREALGRTRGG